MKHIICHCGNIYIGRKLVDTYTTAPYRWLEKGYKWGICKQCNANKVQKTKEVIVELRKILEYKEWLNMQLQHR